MTQVARTFHRLLAALTVVAGIASTCRADLTIDNFQAGDQVRYPVVILRGAAEGKEMAVGTSWKEAIRFPIVNHRYTAIVQLKEGRNMLLLHAGSESMKFRLDYKSATSVNQVLTILVSASDERDFFPSFDPKFNPNYVSRIGVAMKLAQAFTGDAMFRAGYERKSFTLDLNRDGEVTVHRLKSPKTGDELRGMDSTILFAHIQDLVKSQLKTDCAKWCAFMAFSRFDADKRKTYAQFSLANDSQAVFGTVTRHFWPLSFREVPKVFADSSSFDSKTYDESGNRKTVWANLSTGYGTIIHELSHTFGIQGSTDRFSVMSRGFDLLSRAFTQSEAPTEGQTVPTSFTKDEIPKWDPFYSAILNWNPWFQPDLKPAESFEASLKPTVSCSADDILIDAPYGVRVVGAQNESAAPWFTEYRESAPPKRVKLSQASIRLKMGDFKGELTLTVEDDHGQITKIAIH